MITITGTHRVWTIRAENEDEDRNVTRLMCSPVTRDLLDPSADFGDREAVRRALGLDALPVNPYTEVNGGQSFGEMVAAGKYDDVDPRITNNPFKIEGVGRRIMRCRIFHPRRTVTPSDEIIAQMRESGFRPSRPEETLSFGARFPLAQSRYRIVGLGSVSEVGEVLILCRNPYREELQRCLELGAFSGDDSRDIGWRHTNSFLGVCEKMPVQ